MSFQSPPTVLRIKRKRGQDPLQALILEDRNTLKHKRSKPSSLASSIVSTPPNYKQISSENDLTQLNKQKSFHQSLLFTLARTDLVDNNAADDKDAIVQSVLSEASTSGKRKFIIPKRQLEEDTVIPNELTDMLQSLLTVEGPASGAPGGQQPTTTTTQEQPKKRRTRRGPGAPAAGAAASGSPAGGAEAPAAAELDATAPVVTMDAGSASAASGTASAASGSGAAVTGTVVTAGSASSDEDATGTEYVYDVYHLSSAKPMTSANHPSSTIGYIRFFDDEDNALYQSDGEEDDDKLKFSDDEDSNAEDFYQNDYPSDEDEDGNSAGDDESILIIQPNATDDPEEGFDYIDSQDVKDGEFDDIYDQLYDDDDDYDDAALLDDDHFGSDDGGAFERNRFFADDEHSDLALHRDRIFGKLQKMIDDRK